VQFVLVSSTILQTGAFNSKNTNMQSPVVIDPEIMSGAPVFRGTRVPVRILFDHLETGETVEAFLEGYPSVSREHVIAFLDWALRGQENEPIVRK
jgi:uncharacterized protein (DUF433 family)